jgi:hypothetical protein
MRRAVGPGLVLLVLALVGAPPPAADAAGWLPAFDLGRASVRAVDMTPGGDMVFALLTQGGPLVRFRPAGGPLGPIENPFPAGSTDATAALDAAGNTYLLWSRGSVLETRIRRRDASLTAVKTVQSGVLPSSGRVAVSRDGRATFAAMLSDTTHAVSARTLGTDGVLGDPQLISAPGTKIRSFHLGVAGDGDAVFAWTTPDAPPNTQVKARRLDYATQSPGPVLDVTPPPTGFELFDQDDVAVDPAGNATLVWRHDTDPPQPAALTETRQLSAAGALGPTQIVNSSGSTSQGHAVDVDDSGRARITWAEHAAGVDTDPFLPMTCFSAVGSSCGAKLTLSDTQGLITSVGVGPAGDAIVGFAGQGRVLPHPGSGLPPEAAHTLSAMPVVPDLGVDAAGNGVAVWEEGEDGKAAGYDAAPPVLRGITVPAVAERGMPITASDSVFDVWGATSRWTFGDGGTAEGTSVRHTFTSTGTRSVRVTATDGAGASVTATRQITVRDTGRVAVPDTTAPALGRVTMKRARFRVGPARTPLAARTPRRRAPRGSDFRFRLSEAGTVSIAIERRARGRRIHGRCRPTKRRHVAKRRRCVTFVSAGRTLTRTLAAGSARVPFSGRIGRRALRPARFRATLEAVDAAGNASGRRRARFVIVR